MIEEIWAGTVGETMHKHDFDGPWISGKYCEQCPEPIAVAECIEVDKETGTITIKYTKATGVE